MVFTRLFIITLLLAVLVVPVISSATTEQWTTAGTYTWTVPSGVSSIDATIVGAGGGGKGGQGPDTGNSFHYLDGYGSGGGYAGQIRQNVSISVTPGSNITIVVGAGGTGGAGANATEIEVGPGEYDYDSALGGNGNAGSNSSVGAELAAGGAGGNVTSSYGENSRTGTPGQNGHGSESYATSGGSTTGYPVPGAGGSGFGAGGGGGEGGYPGYMTGSTGGTGAKGYVFVQYSATASPVASFSVNSTSITSGDTVKFTDTSTNSPTSWSWSFGDSTSNSTLQSPEHTYTSAGIYTVYLTATNAEGSDTSDGTEVTVSIGTVNEYNVTGTYTWTVPAGVQWVNLTIVGGGGGGASGTGSAYGYGGYAGQTKNLTKVKVTPGQSYTVVVGAGGAADSWGSQSTFGNIVANQGPPGPGTLAGSTSSGVSGVGNVPLATSGESGGSGGIGYGAGGGGGGLSAAGGTGASGLVQIEYGYDALRFPYDRAYAYNAIDRLSETNYLAMIGLFGANETGRATGDGPAGSNIDWSKIISISLNPFETVIGAQLALLIIFALPFIMQWLMQGNSIVPAVTGMVLGVMVIALLPSEYYLIAITFIALSILAVVYSLLKERM